MTQHHCLQQQHSKLFQCFCNALATTATWSLQHVNVTCSGTMALVSLQRHLTVHVCIPNECLTYMLPAYQSFMYRCIILLQ